MTHRLGTLLLTVLAIGCGPSPAAPDASLDAGARPDAARPDAAVDAGPLEDGSIDPPDAGPPTLARFAPRSCDVTIAHAPRVGASRVQVAGDFTGWADAPLELRDDDGDGRFSITLSPNPRLVSGTRHAYKLIVDDTWILDPESPLQAYDADCLNSAFVMPDCASGPEITASTLTTDVAAGAAEVRVTIRAAADDSTITDVSFTLDGAPLPDSAATLDADAGAYDIAVNGLAEGRHVLAARVTDSQGREAAPVDLPFWLEAEPFDWQDATMYMIVVDRFANGDRAIDAPVGAPVEYPADFHGGDLNGALEVMRSGYFESLGVNAIWLSPINRQAEGHFEGRDGSRRFAGYHGYWPSHGREVEPRFGGNEALRALVDEAHSRGIRVLFDLINNQVHEQHEYYRSDPSWFRTGCVCGVDSGCGWSERPLDCLFAPYLPDIDWRVPAAEDRFIDDAIFWVDEMGIDGFRIDAVKHVETHSIVNLRAALSRRFEQGGERLFLVGETAVGEHDAVDFGCGVGYGDGYSWIDAYVEDRALDGQFDFPTHHALQDGLVRDAMSFVDVEAVVRTFETRYAPAGNHVRFLGTHDSNRVASRAAYDPAVNCRWQESGTCSNLPATPTDPSAFARIARAFTILYTMGGIPFLYYGDEIAMPGGGDPDNRRDMVWTDTLSGLAMDQTSVSVEQAALREHVGALGRARSSSRALRRGRRVPLLVTDDLYVIAYADDAPGELAVVAVNRGSTALDGQRIDGLTAGLRGDVTGFESLAGQGSAALVDGRLSLSLPAGASLVLRGTE